MFARPVPLLQDARQSQASCASHQHRRRAARRCTDTRSRGTRPPCCRQAPVAVISFDLCLFVAIQLRGRAGRPPSTRRPAHAPKRVTLANPLLVPWERVGCVGAGGLCPATGLDALPSIAPRGGRTSSLPLFHCLSPTRSTRRPGSFWAAQSCCPTFCPSRPCHLRIHCTMPGGFPVASRMVRQSPAHSCRE